MNAKDIDLEDRITRLTDLERRVLTNVLGRRPTSDVDPIERFQAQMSFGERVADRVASFGGSWTFIGLFIGSLVAWIVVNARSTAPYDPFPFILLNLVLSCVAAMQAPIIMMSQNRQAERDRHDARSDYEVNLRAEMEIMALHAKLDAVREREWQKLERLHFKQLEVLERIENKLTGVG